MILFFWNYLKVIHGNTNLNGVVARDLNPMVNARYLRINPQYWHGWPCLRTDFMGCSAHEGNGMLQCYSTLLSISRHLWLLCHDVFCKQWRLTEQCLEIGRPKIAQTWVRKSNNHSILTCSLRSFLQQIQLPLHPWSHTSLTFVWLHQARVVPHVTTTPSYL